MTQLLTPKAAAARLSVSTRTLRRLKIKKIPVGGRIVRYRDADIERYIARAAGERNKDAA